jgi:carboxymethylenebutenolidase
LVTQDISIEVDGHPMPCYLARPDGDSPKPAVIVLQEIFGVNREVKRISELFASAGYVALAPNYYHRTHPHLNEPYTPDGLKSGFAAAAKASKASIKADVSACIAWLDAQPFVAHGKIAAVGFCYGGTAAFLSATLPGLKAAIPFYGGSIAGPLANGEPEALAEAADVRVPLLLFYGGKDEHIDETARRRVDEALTAAGKPHEIVVYPEVGHAFFRESSDKLNEQEVADAWSRVQAFLAKAFA